MTEAIHYKQSAYWGSAVYLTVQVKEARPAHNGSVLLLGMYVENNSSNILPPLGNSQLGVRGYNGGSAQSFTFPTPEAGEGVTWLAKDLEVFVTHAPDGTAAAVPLYWSWNVKAQGALGMLRPSGSCTVELPPLDLATLPFIYSTNYYSLGDTMHLSIDPCQKGFTHDLSYDVLGATGEIARGVSGRLEWTIPEELLTALTSRHYVSVNLVCTTYRGDVCLGTESCSFYLKPGEAGNIRGQEGWCKLTPVSGHAVVDAWGVCVTDSSCVRADVNAEKVTFAPGAVLSKVQLFVDGKLQSSLTSPVLRESTGHKIRVVLTDSRGYMLSHTEEITPYPYSVPALSAVSCFRSDLEGNADDAGSYLFVAYTPVYSPVGGHNRATVELKIYTPAGVLLSRQPLNGAGVYLGSLSAQSSYRVEVVITDLPGNTNSIAFTIPAQTVAFQIMEGGNGAAFGGIATEGDCLDIHWGRLRLGGQEMADFPVEEGQSGGWTYRKWRSGFAECWGSFSGAVNLSTLRGSLYAGDIAAIELPFAFEEAPVVQAIPTTVSGSPCWLSAATAPGTGRTSAYGLFGPEAGRVNYRLELYCAGRGNK